MHTHLTFDPDPDHMRLYLAQGVTTIRNLSGLSMHLEWRDKVASGQLLAQPSAPAVPRWLAYQPTANG